FHIVQREFLVLFIVLIALGTLYAHHPENKTTDTLAIIDSKVITVNDFAKAYKDKTLRYGLTDNGDVRDKYLNDLIDDEILIRQAKENGLDKTRKAVHEYKRIRLQELLNAYVTRHISARINIKENDLKILLKQMNTRIKVRHLYALTKEKADSLYNELMKGKSFEELAKRTFHDPKLRYNGGLLGYISVDEMDPAFEKAAYSMKVGEISKPVKTVEGYSIIRVDDIKRNPFNTQNEFLKAHDRLQAFARKRAFEEASKEYAESLRSHLDIKFNEQFITKLFSSIQEKTLTNLMENRNRILSGELKKTVVSSVLGKWDLKKLVDEMSYTDEKQKKWIHTRDNLKDFISGLIIRKYIAQRAEKERLDRTPSFSKKVEYNFDTYLLTQIENKLKSRIKISEDSIKAYYNKNIEMFETPPKVRLSSILLNNKELSNLIKDSLEHGISFKHLSRKYSNQRATAQYGGDMGYFQKKNLGILADKVFNLKVGQWIGPLSDKGKYVFLKCTDFKKLAVKPLSESSEEIKQTLIAFKWFKFRSRYADSLKNKINVKIFHEKLNSLNLLTKVDQR
ncbi:MAG: peptidylprolyl isomerase, partial [Ignavibacteriaceae bacterium]